MDTAGPAGAIAVYLASGPSEHRIEVSPAGERRELTHNVVRLHKGGPGPRHVAVFPGLPAGQYTVWQGAAKLAGTVMVRGGEVTDVLLPAGRGTDESGSTLAPSLPSAAAKPKTA